nr:hypothetical protein [Tanacetum cinerariifolium]
MLTMTENVITSGAENGPPILDKSHLNEPFKYGTVLVPGTPNTPVSIRDRTYNDLTDTEKIREACVIKDTVKLLIEGSELSLQERESKLYDEFDKFTYEKGETIHSYYLRFPQLINDMNTIGMTMQKLQVNTKFVNNLQLEWSNFVTHVKLAKNMHESNFNKLYAYFRYASSGSKGNAIGINRTVGSSTKTQALESGVVLDEEQMDFLATDDLDAFDSDCDKAPSASVVLMAKLSAFNSDVFSEVPSHDINLDNNVFDNNVQELQYSEQPPFIDDSNIETTSDNDVISYEQYLNESKNVVVQSTTFLVQQDALIMYVLEEMSNQVAKCNAMDKEYKIVNESLTAELESYKDHVKNFEQRQKVYLNYHEKYIDSQMQDVIVKRKEKFADFEKEIQSLKLNLSK